MEKYREVKWFIQRGRRGYADCDVWDLDSYLSEWLPQALRRIRKITNGYPDYGEAKTSKDWKQILKDMAEGFEAAHKIKDICLSGKRYEKTRAKFKKGMRLFSRYFLSLWD